MLRAIAPNIWTQTSLMQQMQTVVLKSDRHVLFIDPGFFPPELSDLTRQIPAIAQERSPLLALTHSDYDHIAGVPYFPSWPVVASSHWDLRNEKESLAQLAQFDGEFYLDRPWGEAQMPPVTATHSVKDGQVLGPFQFFHTQGHTDDGLMVIWDRAHLAVVGDFLSILEFPFIYTSFDRYQSTIKRFREVFAASHITYLISQHGPPAVTAHEIGQRLDMAERYLEDLHRHVIRHIERGDDPLQHKETIHYFGKPISPSLKKFHDTNIRLVWREATHKSRS